MKKGGKRRKGFDARKSQISIFVIIAILIVGVIAIVLFSYNKLPLINKYPDEVNTLEKTLDSCIKQRAIDAIRLIGLQGGYVNLPKNYLITNISNVAYGYYNGEKTLVKKEKIESEIDYYISITIPYCFSANDFPKINITSGKVSSKVEINDNSVSISAIYPLSIQKGSVVYYLKNPHEFDILVRLGKIYSVANSIIDKEIANPDNIDLTFLSNIDYDITLVPANNNEIIYIITDDKSITDNNIPYSFLFANKFKNNGK